MTSKGLALTVVGAKSGTSGVPTLSLDELNRCRGQLLGGGAFGKVYTIEGFPGLAVKEIWLNEQPDRLKEITKFELEALSRFSHPGVLKYHQVLTNGDFVHIIMDRYHGDLQHFITDHRKTRKPIPRELLLSIVRQLADALAYVHAPYKVNERGDVIPGIVHRDLKPANVLMSKNGERVAIADFGLCKDAQHDGSTLAGTKAYMAPEVFIHSKTSRASDIWAFGVVIYELATLDPPSFSHHWEPEDAKEFFVDGWKPDLRAIEDAFVRAILEKIFVLDPIERPTARELVDRLQTLNTSASKLATQDSVSSEGHRSYIISDSSSSKISFSWTPFVRAITDGDIKAVKRHLSKKGKKSTGDDIALMIAAKAGHADIVELLDPTDYRGVTALMRAAERGDVEAVRALIPLQKGKTARYIKINGWKIYEGTALMIAAARGYVEVLRLLVTYEGGVVDRKGVTALMCAARNGHVECVKLLIEKEGCRRDITGQTALMWAAHNGHTKAVKLLMAKEARIQENNKFTALVIAVVNGYMECVRLLVEKEGGIRTNDGRTALMYAAENGHAECVKLLLEKEAGMQDNASWTALMFAVQNGHVACAMLLAEHEGCMQDSWGWTALMHAARSNKPECVKLLMERECGVSEWTELIYAAYLGDVDAVRNNLHMKGNQAVGGWTALMYAAVQGHKRVVELLRDESGLKNRNNQTALMGAAAHGYAEIVKLLMKKESGMMNSNDQTALMIAAEKGHVECVRLLVEKEGGLCCSENSTALMLAARNGHAECVKLLIEEEVCIYNTGGWTALMFATRWNNLECVKLLAKYEKGMRTNDGETALSIAKRMNNRALVLFLLRG